MLETLGIVCLALSVAVVFLSIVLFRQRAGASLAESLRRLEWGQERGERAVREELQRSREEAAHLSHQLRSELVDAVRAWGQTTVTSLGELGNQHRGELESLAERLVALTYAHEKRMMELSRTVDDRLRLVQEDSAKGLAEIRRTVDEHLGATLERRLGESFQQVSERLEAVHRGLGEMQALAAGVVDLKRVLGNVKIRGTWAEVQLGALLAQIMAPEQYATNVSCKRGSTERVEFALRLPGSGDGSPMWLPIDAKFPVEEYQRLVQAQERGDLAAGEEAGRRLDLVARTCAKDIRDKYLDPPSTTDFAIMFLPTEGLYAEILRRPGLAESLQNDYRVVVAGPATLAALLNSLQIGFRTLAIQKRSSEVWQLLGAVKAQFGQFGRLLDRVHEKLEQASNTVDEAARRSRAIERRLRDVEEMPPAVAHSLLPSGDGEAGAAGGAI